MLKYLIHESVLIWCCNHWLLEKPRTSTKYKKCQSTLTNYLLEHPTYIVHLKIYQLMECDPNIIGIFPGITYNKLTNQFFRAVIMTAKIRFLVYMYRFHQITLRIFYIISILNKVNVIFDQPIIYFYFIWSLIFFMHSTFLKCHFTYKKVIIRRNKGVTCHRVDTACDMTF